MQTHSSNTFTPRLHGALLQEEPERNQQGNRSLWVPQPSLQLLQASGGMATSLRQQQVSSGCGLRVAVGLRQLRPLGTHRPHVLYLSSSTTQSGGTQGAAVRGKSRSTGSFIEAVCVINR